MKKIVKEHLITNRKKYMFLLSMFLLGIVIGVVVVVFLSEQTQSKLIGNLNDFFLSSSQSEEVFDRTDYFRRNFSSELKLYLALWICGLTVLGLGAAPAFIVFKGFVLGFTNTFIITNYGMRGFFYDILTILPQNLIKIPALFFTCVCMISYSVKQTAGRQDKFTPHASPGQLFSLYTVMVAAAFGASLIGVIFESYITPSFIFVFTKEML